MCYLPVIIQPSKEERPLFPRGFVLADHRTGMIHDCHVYEDPGEDMFQVIDRLARHITEFRSAQRDPDQVRLAGRCPH